jgi:flavin-dependent dehydrogenase
VNPGAVAELEHLAVRGRLEVRLTPRRLRGWQVEAPDGRIFRACFGIDRDGRRPEGWAVRRRDFDAAVLEEAERAGVRVRFGVRVCDVIGANGRVAGVVARAGAGTSELRARFVVGADGLRSVVQRRLDLARRPARLRKIALVGHLAEAGDGNGFGELRVRGGRTCGYAPLPHGGNVTLVIPADEAAEVGGSPRDFFTAALSEFPEVQARVRAGGLETHVLVTGPFDRPVRRAWSPGALLVGDAAGYYDPFTGQGIYQALRSARLAAEAIDTALTDSEKEIQALARYGRRMSIEFGPKRGLQRFIEAAVSRPAVMSRFVCALSSRKGIAAGRLLRATGDLVHPAELLDPALWIPLLSRLVYGK